MFDSSQEEMQSMIHSFLDTYSCPGDADASAFINYLISTTPSQTAYFKQPTEEEKALITPPAKLEARNPEPEPEPQNGNDCSAQASRSATDAIRQASQQASESIRQAGQSASQAVQQANQSASQAIQQASQSATNAIRQAENGASQAVAQASRSSSSISSSASSAISSADQAVSRANESARVALANASQAILQASAAIAAATGSAAAAGSSFLEAAARATQGTTQPSFSSGKQTDAQQNPAASPAVGLTATQAALAIVGSIFASTLITFLIYYFFRRHRKKARQSRRESWRSRNLDEGRRERKLSSASSEQSSRMYANFNKETGVGVQRSHSNASSAMLYFRSPNLATKDETSAPRQIPEVKETYIFWNSKKTASARKAGGAWLAPVSTIVSPFGSIKLPTDDDKKNAPLGGQLKSPLFSVSRPAASDLPLRAPQIQGPLPVAERGFKPPVQQQQYAPSSYTSIQGPDSQKQSIRSKERSRARETQRAVLDYDATGNPSPSPKKEGRGRVGEAWDDKVARREEDRIMKNELEWSGVAGGGGLSTPDTSGIGSARIMNAVRGVVIAPRKSGRSSEVKGSGLRGQAL